MDEELYDLLKQKRKDDAIKYIRNKYDMDFKSAKETIDKMTKTLEFFEGKNRGLSKTDFSDMFKNSIISRDVYKRQYTFLARNNGGIFVVNPEKSITQNDRKLKNYVQNDYFDIYPNLDGIWED